MLTRKGRMNMLFLQIIRAAGSLGGIGLILMLSAQLKREMRRNLKHRRCRHV